MRSSVAPVKALIVDSWFDSYVGVVILVRVFDGTLRHGDKIKLMATGATYEITKMGVFTPAAYEGKELAAGEVGFVIASIKTLRDARVGDTVTTFRNPATEALSGFKEAKPMVFSGIFPTDGADYDNLKDALEKLQLNDAAINVEPDPPKQSSTISPRREQSRIASATSATGLTVGCMASSSARSLLIELMPA